MKKVTFGETVGVKHFKKKKHRVPANREFNNGFKRQKMYCEDKRVNNGSNCLIDERFITGNGEFNYTHQKYVASNSGTFLTNQAYISPTKSETSISINDSFDTDQTAKYIISDFDDLSNFFNEQDEVSGEVPNRLHETVLDEFIDSDVELGEIIDSTESSILTDYNQASELRNEDNSNQDGLSYSNGVDTAGSSTTSSHSVDSQGYEEDILECITEPDDASASAPRNSYEVFEINNSFLIILNPQKFIRIFGLCNINILYGKVNILGHERSAQSGMFPIYSTRGNALLTIGNNSDVCEEICSLKTLIPNFILRNSLGKLQVRKDCAVFLSSNLECSSVLFIEKYISQQILPMPTNLPRIEIEPKGVWNDVKIPGDWAGIMELVSSSTRLLISGGKGVGKSTFLRYAINDLLQKFSKVRVIDLDPGQSEFTVPGSISVLTISEPLFGVNYTHLKKTERSILCDINVGYEPRRYLSCVESLMQFNGKCKPEEDIPTLINYVGYTTDLAFNLVSSTIVLVKPTTILLLQSKNRKKNFRKELSSLNVQQNATLLQKNNATIDFEFNVHKIQSMSDEKSGWTLEARQMREMCILSYFGQMMSGNSNSILDCKLPIYIVAFGDVTLCTHKGVEVSSEAANANLVSLCSLEKDTELFQCHGWGIVRGVDEENKNYFIITPEPYEVLEKVTHLVVGCLTLPPSIYMVTDNASGNIPYVMEGELVDFGQLSKRTNIAPTRK